MKIKEEIQISLTPKEVKEIIKKHFKKEYNLESVYFNVEIVYGNYGDYPNYEMTRVNCTGKNIK